MTTESGVSDEAESEDHSLPGSPPPWRPWGRELRRALYYPLRVRGILFFLSGAFVWSAGECGGLHYVRMVTLPLVGFYIAFCYTYIVNIVRDSAQGSDDLPPFLFREDLLDDVVHPFWDLLVLLLLCYLPVLISVWWKKGGFLGMLMFVTMPYESDLEPWQIVLNMLGGFYFPMAMLALTVKRDIRAVSPHVVVPSIVRVPLPYMIIAGTFLWMNGLHNRIQLGIQHSGWVEVSIVLFLVKVGLLYTYSVLGRVLGKTYWVYRRRLGWFERV